MKVAILAVLLAVAGLGAALAPVPVEARSEFCAGFRAGYITGYKQASGSGYRPYVPYCPYQPYKGLGDPESDFEHGYTIGYRKGFADGSR